LAYPLTRDCGGSTGLDRIVRVSSFPEGVRSIKCAAAKDSGGREARARAVAGREVLTGAAFTGAGGVTQYRRFASVQGSLSRGSTIARSAPTSATAVPPDSSLDAADAALLKSTSAEATATSAGASAGEAAESAEPPKSPLRVVSPMAFGEPEAVRVTGEVSLSDDERHLFSTLREIVAHYGLGTQLRVAGGWVRDKLIGHDCIDIDIALDNMLGRQFAEKVTEYLKDRGETVRGVGVIQKNPEQSKHLETATMMIHGIWIDLVNLRAEEYTHDSRIPTAIEFGTAEEDALRRDLTINSMFYNITTEHVEDPTGRGISDLKGGIIRTPLPPHQTFLDDPLRVLRAVRFAARFGFSLDEELRSAAASEEVRAALGNKVSKERIGKEVELMLKSRDPYAAIALIVDLNLFPTVFPLPHAPSHTADVPPDDELPGLCEASFAATCTRLHQWKKHLPQALNDHSSDLTVGLLLASLLLPLRHAHYLDKKKKDVPFAQHIVLDSLKLKRAYADMVVLLHAAAEDFAAIAPLLVAAASAGGDAAAAAAAAAAAGGGGETRALTLISAPHEEFQGNARVLAGKLLRKVKACWPSAVLLASTLPPISHAASGEQCMGKAEEQRERKEEDRKGEEGEEGCKRRRMEGSEGGAVEDGGCGSCHHDQSEFYLKVLQAVHVMGLDGVWDTKPILNGRDVVAALALGKGDSRTGYWMDRVMEWQLAHSGNGSIEECMAWLKAQAQAVGGDVKKL
ncbi:hypothetical protein CLOM_g24246, partial [Closterium sp. NIES-68]